MTRDSTSLAERYAVVIAGGGLAGLCLAIQLKRREPGLPVLVVEKSRHPAPEAAHKVGESSVEIASHYFRNVLGLADVLARETPKFGLRFFLSHDGNRDITQRLEFGPSQFLHVPSFQIDRGRFENELAKRAIDAGVRFVDDGRVTSIELGDREAGRGEDHVVQIERETSRHEVRCRWLVDASGRPGILKKKLGIARPNHHAANAVWFRLDASIDPDDWSDSPTWRARVKESRRLSTNHLMGRGYWVWLIPLVCGRTSVGIVTDAGLHAFSDLNTFDKAMRWLEEHEPQCASILTPHTDQRMDFLALKDYSHDARRVFSAAGWGLVGDAGTFVDPLYSPGSDLIGLANGFLTELILRDHAGEEIGDRATVYDQSFRALARTLLANFQRQYALMGNPRVMSAKIVWDFVMYWGGIAQIFCADRFADLAFMGRARPILQRFGFMNVSMQGFFREWSSKSAGDAPPRPGVFIDYATIPVLDELNRNLLGEYDDAALLDLLERNLQIARDLRLEMRAEASRAHPELASDEGVARTSHLCNLFEAITPARASPAHDGSIGELGAR